jgi:hypothetical protein
MTTTNPTRRPSRRAVGHRVTGHSGQDGRSPVGERLRDAREIRGVDLFRVERDTKIRSKYLAALEDGDFMDLPGDVYARGFLRNYATYLGLDADEIEEEWRDEAGHAAPALAGIVGPQPMTIRRGIVFQRSHVVIAMVIVIVLAVGSYFGYQLTRYLSYPTVAVESAGPSPIYTKIGATDYTLTGTATAGTTVLIAWNGQDPQIVTADDGGHWTYHAVLRAGSNQFDVTAKNLDTSHASNTVRLIVVVPVATPTPLVPEVAFTTPADLASVAGGTVNVTGYTVGVSSVSLTTTYLGPPAAPGTTLPPATPSPVPASVVPGGSPSTSPGASGSPGPSPKAIGTAPDGTFAISAALAPGRWQLTIVGMTARGVPTKAVSRTITVPYKGVNVIISVKGDIASVSYYHDGLTDDNGTVHDDGWSVNVVGNKWVCVNTTRPAYVYITVNGISYGSIAGLGGRRAWMDTTGPPRNVDSCAG